MNHLTPGAPDNFLSAISFFPKIPKNIFCTSRVVQTTGIHWVTLTQVKKFTADVNITVGNIFANFREKIEMVLLGKSKAWKIIHEKNLK